MGLTDWLRGLFHRDPQEAEARERERGERNCAKLEAEAAKAEAAAHAQQFPRIPPV